MNKNQNKTLYSSYKRRLERRKALKGGDSNTKKKWWRSKIVTHLITGLITTGLGFVSSYLIFHVKAKHEAEMYGHSDGHYYATKQLKGLMKRTPIEIRFLSLSLFHVPMLTAYEGARARRQIISKGRISLGSLVFEHWGLLKHNKGVKNLKVALREINEGIRRSPEKIHLYWYRGLVHFQLGQYDWAVLDFQYVLEKWPHFVKSGLALATAYCKLHFYEEALAILQRFNDNDLQTVAGYNAMGNIYFHLAQERRDKNKNKDAVNYYLKALSSYQKSIDMNSQYSVAYNNRAWAYYIWKDYQSAIKDYSQAIKLNPRLAIAYNNRGLVYAACEKYREAIQDFNEAIKLNPKFALAYNNRGLAYSSLKQYGKAIRDFDEAINLKSDLAATYHNRGWAYYRLKKTGTAKAYYEQAIKDFTMAVKYHPEYYMAYYGRGAAYMEIGEFEKAIKDFDKAVKIRPKFYVAILGRGNAYYRRNMFKKAIENYGKAIEINPEYAALHWSRGGAHYRLNEFRLAIKNYIKAIIMYEKANRIKVTAAVYCSLGRAYDKSNQFKDALDSYYQAIERDHKYCRTYNNLGRLWLKRAKQAGWRKWNLIRAFTVLAYAIALKHNDASAYFNRGEAFREVGLYQEALRDYDSAIRHNSKTAEYYLTRGRTCVLLGKIPKAMDDYDKGLHIQIPWLRPATDIQGISISRIQTPGSLFQNPYPAVLEVTQFFPGQ